MITTRDGSGDRVVVSMRDFTTRPYSIDEQRVVDYLKEIMPEIGAGDDPIGFLIASHAALADRTREFMKAYESILDCNDHG